MTDSFVAPEPVLPEVTTVADDTVVLWTGAGFDVHVGLEPDTSHHLGGADVRTLPRPPGELLATVATVNDVHFGETVCGQIDDLQSLGPPIPQPEGEPPYYEVMNRAVVSDIQARQPDLVVAKGDLTTHGTVEEYQQFLDCYGVLGDRLVHVRGNHDSYHGADFAAWPMQRRDLPGVTVAVLDTARVGTASGRVSAEQLEWLDTLGAEADRPVLVFGHHHVWDPSSRERPDTYFGVHPDDSESLVEVFARRPRLAGWFAGHTHRNRVRRFAATAQVPFVEVACTKDFPGGWAEYRVFEGGILQVFRRVQQPAAVAWAERTRELFGGLYPAYAFGDLSDRCFVVC